MAFDSLQNYRLAFLYFFHQKTRFLERKWISDLKVSNLTAL